MHAVVQVPAPPGDFWIVTRVIVDPSPPSEAVAWSVTVAWRFAPGSVIVAERLKAFDAVKLFPLLALAAVNAAPEKVTPATPR